MLKKILKNSELVRHVLTLLQGTVIAQLISILMQSVLRRVFTVSDFGIMSLYASAIVIFASLATGRYEMAIVLPKEDKNARSVFRISLGLSFLFNLFLFIVLLFSAGTIMDIIIEKELIDPNEITDINLVKYLIYCIPVGVFTLTAYNSFNYLYTRKKAYKTLSRGRIVQSLAYNGSSAAFGVANIGFFGLFFGYVLGLATSIIFMIFSKFEILKGEVGNTRENLKKYADFPKKSMPSGLINMLALQLPTFFIFGFFGSQISGLYDMITRVLNVPLTMVGKSVSQVFFQKVSQDLNDGKPISEYIIKSTKRLLLLMLFPMLIIFFFGEPIFALLFGEDYRMSGKLASYFSISYLMRFVYYSQSTLFSAVRMLGVELRQNIIYLIFQITALVVGYYYYKDFEITFILVALSGFLCYSYFIYGLIKVAKLADK